MSTTTIVVMPERRTAVFCLPWARKEIGTKPNEEVRCHVLGLFQFMDADAADAYFVVELEDGRCAHIPPEYLRFTFEERE